MALALPVVERRKLDHARAETGLLLDLLEHGLGWRLVDVGPAPGQRPEPGETLAYEQHLARPIDRPAHVDLRRHVARLPRPELQQPLERYRVGTREQLGRDPLDLDVALAVVLARAEVQTGARQCVQTPRKLQQPIVHRRTPGTCLPALSPAAAAPSAGAAQGAQPEVAGTATTPLDSGCIYMHITRLFMRTGSRSATWQRTSTTRHCVEPRSSASCGSRPSAGRPSSSGCCDAKASRPPSRA